LEIARRRVAILRLPVLVPLSVGWLHWSVAFPTKSDR
jgi:hypothetical protein